MDNEASAAVGNDPAPLVGSGLSFGSTGQFGSALVGSGTSSSSDYINTGWNLSLSGSWSISFYTSNIPTSTTLWYIFGDQTTGFRCFTNGVAGANNWILRATGMSDLLVQGGATSAPHVTTFVYDANAGQLRGYLDGSLQNTVSQSSLTLSGGLFKVGAYSSSTNLSGRIDEFRFYSHALSSAEVAATWNQTLPLAIAEFPYCEDFESNDGNWAEGGILPTWEHGEPNNSVINSAYSGDNAWVTNLDGNYNNDELSYVRSPRIDLTALNSPAIRFYTIRNMQNNQDGVTMQVSQDSGATWTTLGSTSSTAPWYNSSSIAALNSAYSNGNGWTGNNSSWIPMQHSLASFSNDTSFFVRFVMAADGSTVGEGFGFDDVLIGETNDVSVTGLYYPDSACGTSNTEIRASICNVSVVEKYGFSITLDTNNATAATVNYGDTLPVCGCDTVTLFTFNTTDGGEWDLYADLSNTGDVNTSNDTVSGSMFIYATPKVALTGGGDYCEGEAAQLTFTFTGTAPFNLSYTNGTNGIYNGNLTTNPFVTYVTSSGTYAPLYVTDASGCPADTSGITGVAEVVFNPNPQPDLGAGGSVCGPQLLDAGTGFTSYAWSTGSTGQSIYVTQSGTYSVTVTDTLGCSGTSTVSITILPLPVVELPDTVLCEGGTFLFNAGGGQASYLWHNGSTGQLFQTNTVGQVSVTVTGFNGCVSVDSGSITAVVSNPIPTLTSTAGFAPVTLDAGSGYIAYLWNTNAMTQTIQVSVQGIYTCTVTDLNGCVGEGTVKSKIWPTGVEEVLAADGWMVYPNPASNFIQIRFANASNQSRQIDLIDLKGALVRSWSFDIHTSERQFDISNLPAGSYTLRALGDQSVNELPLLIQR